MSRDESHHSTGLLQRKVKQLMVIVGMGVPGLDRDSWGFTINPCSGYPSLTPSDLKVLDIIRSAAGWLQVGYLFQKNLDLVNTVQIRH